MFAYMYVIYLADDIKIFSRTVVSIARLSIHQVTVMDYEQKIHGGPKRMQHLRSLISKNHELNQINECINE